MMRQFLLVTTAVLVGGSVIGEPRKRSVEARGLSSWGGFPLLESSCPSGTEACGKTSCCPTGYTCTSPNTNQPLCCPSTGDCTSTVTALYACANNTWGLYWDAGYFCCTPDQAGTYASGVGQQCIDKSLPIPSSISLTLVSQITATSNVASTQSTTPTALATDAQTTAGNSGAITSSNAGSGSGSGTATTIAAGSGNTQTAGGGSANKDSSSSSSGLSQNAIIAIAVLAAVVLVLALVIGWRFRRRRSNKYQGPGQQPPMQYFNVAPPERPYSVAPPYSSPLPQAPELSTDPTKPIYETDGAHRIELDGQGAGGRKP